MRSPFLFPVTLLCLLSPGLAQLGYLEQLPKETFEKMREVERYQLKAAEKHYLAEDFEAALNEYDKFLTLYEKSVAAPYAQLMWSHCQVRLRKANTAIKDGFQSVIDYWPDSHEAVLAEFLIARTRQDIGEVEVAEKLYHALVAKRPQHATTLMARQGLLKMARDRKDDKAVRQVLNDILTKTEATDGNKPHLAAAGRELAGYSFAEGEFDAGVKMLERFYQERELTSQIAELAMAGARHLKSKKESEAQTKADGMLKVVFGLLEKEIPADLKDEENRALALDRLNRIAALHGEFGKPADVLATLERIGKLLGEDDAWLGRMAQWFKAQNQRDKAKAFYARFKDQIAAQAALAGMLVEEGKVDEAIAIYRELMVKDSEKADSYQWTIGECYEHTGRIELAIQSYRQCENFPTNYFRMASCHRKLKQYPEALALYQQIKSHPEAAPEAFLQLGFTHEEAGEKEKAITSFQQTCKQHPKSGQASQAHAHLQSVYKITITLGGAQEK